MTKKSQSNVAAVATAQTQDTQTMRRLEHLDEIGRKGNGLKWDPVKKTIDATDAWWEKKLQEIPEAAKFRTTGLAHVVKVEMLFTDITAAREGPWVPSSILIPDDIGATNGVGVRCDEGNDTVLEGLGDLDDEPNLSAHECSMCDRKRKKEVQIVSQHLGRMCDILESRSAMPSKRPDKLGCSIVEVMDVVRKIAEIENDIDMLMIASEVLLTRSHREMFVALKEPKFQIEFLKRMRNVKISH